VIRNDLQQRLDRARARFDASHAEAYRNYCALCQLIDDSWFTERRDAIDKYVADHPGESKEGWTP